MIGFLFNTVVASGTMAVMVRNRLSWGAKMCKTALPEKLGTPSNTLKLYAFWMVLTGHEPRVFLDFMPVEDILRKVSKMWDN